VRFNAKGSIAVPYSEIIFLYAALHGLKGREKTYAADEEPRQAETNGVQKK
jgi:hypothetical protein